MKVDADIKDIEEGHVSSSGEANGTSDNRGTHHEKEDMSMGLHNEDDVSLCRCTDRVQEHGKVQRKWKT